MRLGPAWSVEGREIKTQRGEGSAPPQALSLFIPLLCSQVTYDDGNGGGSREQGWHNLPSLRQTLTWMF